MIRVRVTKYDIATIDDFVSFQDMLWDYLRYEAKLEAEANCLMIPPEPNELLVGAWLNARGHPCNVHNAAFVRLSYTATATG